MVYFSSARTMRVVLLAGAVALAAVAANAAEKIEAKSGKNYPLSKTHGPWLIMVASFQGTDEDKGMKTATGKTPAEAADALVLELRQKGMPAYMFETNNQREFVETKNARGQTQRRKNLRRIDSVCVLAGNYPSIDDKKAKESLAWIKKLDPKCMSDGVYNMIGQKTPGRPKPLSGAFLTQNPLSTSADRERVVLTDPLLLRLNTGQRNSLTENKGKYTLVVATFGGNFKTVNGNAEKNYDPQKVVDQFDNAVENAQKLAQLLRDYRKIEAYVWHDEYKSVVTVGSFEDSSSPAAVRLQQQFGVKMKKDRVTGAPTQTTEMAILARNGRQHQLFAFDQLPVPEGWEPRQIWPFDLEPQIIAVPRLK